MRRVLAIVALSCGACTFDSRIPAGAHVRCDSNADCPPGFACQLGTSRCVPEAELDLAPPELVGAGTLALVPDRLNPLANPTAMARGTRAQLTFQVSEPLAQPPEVRACPDELACSFQSASGLVQVFACGFLADPPPPVTKACPVTVELVDLAQQRATLALALEAPGLRLDTEAPSAPAVDTADAVVLARAPWGSDQTAGAPRAQVQGFSGAAAEPGWVLVLDPAGRELARGPSAANGAFGPVVLSADLAEAWVALIDEAGNVSASVRVRDVEWTATMGLSSNGPDNLNPHRFFERPAHSATLRPAVPSERYASDGVATRDGGQLTTLGAWVWRERNDAIVSDFAGTSVYDSARARVVSFGGEVVIGGPFGGGVLPSEQLIEWNGDDWQVLTPRTRPEARRRHGIAYHAALGQTVIFGGVGWTRSLNDTWTWDGLDWVQARGALAPPGGLANAMTYDSRREKVVLFSGAGGGQTWEWDGEWTLRAELDGGPSPRIEHRMAWDPGRKSTLLFGGRPLRPDGGVAPGVLSDFWEFDGASWVEIPRDGGAWPTQSTWSGGMVVDVSRQIVLVQVTGGTWEWNQAGWRQVPELTDTGLWPQTLLAWDAARGEALLFGRTCYSVFGFTTCDPPETISWNGVARTVRRRAGSSRGTRFAFDPAHGGILSVAPDAGTRLWDGAGWRLLNDGGPPLPATLTYDSDAGEMLGLAAGAATQALGADAGWTTLLAVLPADAGKAAAVYDERLGGVLVLGGAARPEAWLWNAGQWVERPDLALPAVAPSLAPVFDPVRRRTVVTAENSTSARALPWHALFELVESDAGFSWLATGAAPSGDGGWISDTSFSFQPEIPAVAYDRDRERLIRFGLRGDFPVSGRTVLREWTSGGWLPVEVYDAEGQGAPDFGVNVPSLVFNPVLGRTALLREADHWELESANRFPSHVFQVALAASGLPREAIVSITANATAGGTGADAGAAVSGAQLALWREGTWWTPSTVGAWNTSGPSSPDTVSLTLTAGELERTLWSARDLSVAVFPRGPNGSGTASVTTDYIELRVRFRLAP